MPRPTPALILLLVATAAPFPAAGGAGCTDDVGARCEDPRTKGRDASPLAPRVVEISLGPGGFTPSEVTVPRGVPVRFVITRGEGRTCAAGLRIPALDVEAQVPRGTPTVIMVTPRSAGVFPVTCVGEGVAGLLVVG